MMRASLRVLLLFAVILRGLDGFPAPAGRGRGGPRRSARSKARPRRPPQKRGGAGDAAGGPADGLRLNKAFPDLSRREADRIISAGRVEVNGRPAAAGSRVRPADRITVDGKAVRNTAAHVARELGGKAAAGRPRGEAGGAVQLQDEPFTYLKYWKPRGVTTTVERSDRTNVIDAAGLRSLPRRVFPVGRLDKESTGLLLLTADGRVPNAMLSAERCVEKVYTVSTKRRVSDAELERLRSGVKITTPVQRDSHSSRGGSQKVRWVTAATKPCRVSRTGPAGGTALRFVLQEGRNRQIRRMLGDAMSHAVVSLHRDSFGGVTLKGLREGQWCECSKAEMKIILAALRAEGEEEGPRRSGGGGGGGGNGGGGGGGAQA